MLCCAFNPSGWDQMTAFIGRRKFIALLGGLVAPTRATAQHALPRIGILSPEALPPGLLREFERGLRDLGYVPNQNIAFEMRNAEGVSHRLAALADELVRLQVDVILAVNTPAVQAAKRASATIPIVMTRVANPIKLGLVNSLSRPGGNVTGLTFIPDEVNGKRLQLLKEIFPSASRAAVLWYGPNPGTTLVVHEMAELSAQLGIELLLFPVNSPNYLAGVFDAARSSPVQALVVVDDAFITKHRLEILDLAMRHSLPVFALWKAFAEAGAVMAYGASTDPIYRRAAHYVDRILKGAIPADLPVEQPTKFELVINLKSAKALGIEIPPTLLARADEVIE
jgi:putative ABC transport system substrate-binding protein